MGFTAAVTHFCVSDPQVHSKSSTAGYYTKALAGCALAALAIMSYNKPFSIPTGIAVTGLVRHGVMSKIAGKDDDSKLRKLEEGTFQPLFRGAYLAGAGLCAFGAYKIAVLQDCIPCSLVQAAKHAALPLTLNVCQFLFTDKGVASVPSKLYNKAFGPKVVSP